MIIMLTKNQQCLVDDEDKSLVEPHSWCVLDLRSSRRGLMYAVSSIKGKFVYMHRLLINANRSETVDHINGNGLDNRRSNLRKISRSRNALNKRHTPSNNTSGITGVYWITAKNKYRTEIKVDKKKYHLGYFLTKKEATTARKDAELRLIPQ